MNLVHFKGTDHHQTCLSHQWQYADSELSMEIWGGVLIQMLPGLALRQHSPEDPGITRPIRFCHIFQDRASEGWLMKVWRTVFSGKPVPSGIPVSYAKLCVQAEDHVRIDGRLVIERSA